MYIYRRILVYPGVPFLYNWDFAEFFSHNQYLTILYEAPPKNGGAHFGTEKTHGVGTISKAHHGPSHLPPQRQASYHGQFQRRSCAATVLIGPFPSISSMIDLYC